MVIAQPRATPNANSNKFLSHAPLVFVERWGYLKTIRNDDSQRYIAHGIRYSHGVFSRIKGATDKEGSDSYWGQSGFRGKEKREKMSDPLLIH